MTKKTINRFKIQGANNECISILADILSKRNFLTKNLAKQMIDGFYEKRDHPEFITTFATALSRINCFNTELYKSFLRYLSDEDKEMLNTAYQSQTLPKNTENN